MYTEILVRYAHFLSIIIMMSTIVGEHLLLKPSMTRQELYRMSIIDGVYGVSAIAVVAAGLTLWFGVGKPADFYTQNWIFHLKMTLVILAGLLSIYPTVFFIRNRKGEAQELVEVPRAVKMVIRLELLLLIFAPLCATFMARGVGYFG